MAGRRPLPLLGAAVTAVLLLASPAGATETAAADDVVRIAHIEAKGDTLRLLVDVPSDAAIDLEQVAVTVDGAAAASTRAEGAGTTGTIRRTAVIAMDTSDSMSGARFEAAQGAARAFLGAVPTDVEVGIVSFAGTVEAQLQPTTDRDAARAVVDDLTLSRQTRLYDGVRTSLEMAGTDGQRTVLVLSDGADTSDTALDEVVDEVEAAGVILDVVSLDQRGKAADALAALADAGGGSVVDADPDALSQAFSAEAEILARQVLVTATVPPGTTASSATIEVTLTTTGGEPLVAEAFASISAPPAPAAPQVRGPEGGLVLDTTWLYAGLGALAVGLVVLGVMLAPRRERELTPEERAAAYAEMVAGRDGATTRKVEPDQALAQAKDAAQKMLARNRTLEARIARNLDAAGSPLKPAEWLLVRAAIFVASGLLGLLLGAGNPVQLILLLALGALGPMVYLKLKMSRRKKAFESALPETLQLMSGSLAAGLSLAQSVDTIVREGVDPVAGEFRRVLVETRLGISLEEALQGVADRFESKDFAWAVMAIGIQRQVGGNLAELLNTVAATMREREYMRRQVAALAAEGKLSAWVLGGLPPLFMLYLLVTNRDYVIVMFTEPMGWLMLAGAATLLGIGIFWMSRLVKVEI